MAEEIKIKAELDVADFENGVKRVKSAAQEMSDALSKAFKREKGDDTSDPAEAFTKGLNRTAIGMELFHKILHGVGETLKQVSANLTSITGADFNLDPWKAWADILTKAALAIPKIKSMAVLHANSEIANIRSEEKGRRFLAQMDEDPSKFGVSTAQIDRNIEKVHRQDADDKINNQRFHANGNKKGPGATISDDDLKKRQADSTAELALLEKEKTIAEKRDALRDAAAAKRAEDTKEKWARDDAKKVRMQSELESSINESMATYRQAEHKEKEKAKKLEGIRLENLSESDEKKKTGGEHDLSETERSLGNLKATSAVKINGGMFGKNDAASSLVQHAAQQVSLLSSIDAELKAIRQQRQDLSLL